LVLERVCGKHLKKIYFWQYYNKTYSKEILNSIPIWI
jgi:hypothetical protein